MLELIEKENLSSNNKIAKPDLATKTGREFLSYYLQAKLRQLVLYDAKAQTPIIKNIKSSFISSFARRMVTDYEKRILIGVTGESACGKTTICRKLQEISELYDMPIEILSADNYFNDISNLVNKHGGFGELMKTGFDIDAPSNFQLGLLKEDLQKLAYGRDIMSPQYLLNGTGVSVARAIPVISKKIIVVEGICTSYGDLSDVLDVKIFVEADNEKRKELFLKRGEERNQSYDECLNHWNYINDAAEKYIRPAKENADIVVNGYADIEYFGQLFSYLYKITNNFATEKN